MWPLRNGQLVTFSGYRIAMQSQVIFLEIKASLVRAGVTQRGLADELSISPSSIHKVMRGQCVSRRVMDLIVEKIGWNPWPVQNGRTV